MSLVKVVRNGQITLPAELRRALDLEEGDYLEVNMEGRNIVLKPKVVVSKEKEKAWEDLNDVLEDVHRKNEGVDPREVEEVVQEAVRVLREGNSGQDEETEG